MLKPPLKWAGGKRWLVPHLKPLWEKNHRRRLVEPLCGGLAVALGLEPKNAFLNDINPHTINFYQRLKAGFRIRLKMVNDRDLYYAHRDEFNQLIASGRSDSHRAAELFYYLNRTGYNGLCRFNKSGLFNVPFGRHRTINYVRDFSDYKSLLGDWSFTNNDFEEIETRRDDFIYADPPYDVVFTQYAQKNFLWPDQVRLVEWLAKHPGPVVLSNQATDRIVALYEDCGFSLQFVDAPRMISCKGDRTRAREVIATKGLGR